MANADIGKAFTTVKGVVHYPYLTEKDEGRKYSNNKYGVTMSFDKVEDKEGIKAIKDHMEAWGKARHDGEKFSITLKDGDKLKKSDGTKNETFIGRMVLKMASSYEIDIKDNAKKAVTAENADIQDGQIARACFVPFAYNSPASGIGVTALMNKLQYFPGQFNEKYYSSDEFAVEDEANPESELVDSAEHEEDEAF